MKSPKGKYDKYISSAFANHGSVVRKSLKVTRQDKLAIKDNALGFDD